MKSDWGTWNGWSSCSDVLAEIPGFLLERGIQLAQSAQSEQLEVVVGLGLGLGLSLLPIAAGWLFSLAMEGILGGAG